MELLVVIAIISILTVITVSQFETARKKARDAQRKGDINSVSKALLMYYADYNKFPKKSAINSLLVMSPGEANEFKDDQQYIYMKVMPRESRSGWAPYCYEVDDTNPTKFAIYTMLENTADSDCHLKDGLPLYQDKCGTHDYCFAITSPNARLNSSTGELE